MFLDFDSFPSIPAVFFKMVELEPERVVYSQAVSNPELDTLNRPRQWETRTYNQIRERILKITAYLSSFGVGKGSKVAILSSSRPEWMEADIAIQALGGVEVSIYHSYLKDDVGYILYDSQVEIVFAENQEQLNKLANLLSSDFTVAGHEDRETLSTRISLKKIITFETTEPHDLAVDLETILLKTEAVSPRALPGLERGDLASLVYTSGTTGPPKGVKQSHGNHLANVRQCYHSGFLSDKTTIMIFLPLAHSFAKMMAYLGFLTPATLKFPAVVDQKTSSTHPESVMKDLREGSAFLVPIVPRILEKMMAGIVNKALESGIQARILRFTIWAARKVYLAKLGEGPPPILARIGFEGTRTIREQVRRKLFGSDFEFAISGGAKLNPEVAVFFDSLGIEVLEGYGLTETCVATNVNRSGNNRVGTVGPVLDDDIEVLIAEDGEILFRGPNVASGYYHRETATKEAWDKEGWFHTGDLGSLSSDGYLAVAGRKKEILVTSNGKNIAPEPIEKKIGASRYVSQVVLIGDSRPFCAALISLENNTVKTWAEQNGLILEGDFASYAAVQELLHKEVEKVNEKLPRYERVRGMILLSDSFSVENGMLTPTFKVKRSCVIKRYQDRIEDLYSGC